MGLPNITFALEKAATTVSSRLNAGRVALLMIATNSSSSEEGYEDVEAGLYLVARESDIPAGLSDDHKAFIKSALIGYLNAPEAVYVSIEGEAIADFDSAIARLSQISYDYVATCEDDWRDDLATYVKTARTGRYIGKAVIDNGTDNDPGVIRLLATGIEVDGEEIEYPYTARIAGLLAGTPPEASATYAALPEVTAVDELLDPDASVDAGNLILVDDGRQIKLGRAVTSKSTLAAGELPLLKKIKLVAGVDLIRYGAITTIEDEYLGKCANSYDNKCILITALRAYMSKLEDNGVLVSGSSGAELDADAIRTYLLTAAAGDEAEIARIKSLSDPALRKEDTGSHVFIRLLGKLQDAMEDFAIVLDAN